jgi:hypothetical protein
MLEQVHLRRDHQELTIFGLDDLPPPFMDEPVVPMTEKDKVFELGISPKDPVLQVMADCVGRRSVAAGPPATFVANSERFRHRP